METILAHAQQLVYTLFSLMPSQYQQDNLQAMLGLFLEAQGHPLPQHSKTKSASALFLFLLDLERMHPLALSHGIYIQISRCKI